MTLAGLALRNIRGSAFRSAVICLCVLLVTGFSLTTALIIRGSAESAQLALEKLGADIVVVPEGLGSTAETALFTARSTSSLMPAQNRQRVAAVPGVAAASPQLFLGSLSGTQCCGATEIFLVAYDPATDFTVRAWLPREGDDRPGEAVGGSDVNTPDRDRHLMIYGHSLALRGNLEPTGTSLDQTVFVSFETARQMAAAPEDGPGQPLEVPPDHISAVMVRVQPGVDLHGVAIQIIQDVPGVTPIESPRLFQAFRQRMLGLAQGLLVVLGTAWGLSAATIGLIFAAAANARQREIGTLRALGCSSLSVLRCLLVEAVLLALSGGIAGAGLTSAGAYALQDPASSTLGMPFAPPSPSELLWLIGMALALALVVVVLAALVPGLRLSLQDPAAAMRE